MSEEVKKITIAEFIATAFNKHQVVDAFFLEAGGAKYIGESIYGTWEFPDGSEMNYDEDIKKWVTR